MSSNDILITQIVDTKDMKELIYLFNKKARPSKPRKENDI